MKRRTAMTTIDTTTTTVEPLGVLT